MSQKTQSTDYSNGSSRTQSKPPKPTATPSKRLQQLENEYQQLSSTARHVLQVVAICGEAMTRNEIIYFSFKSGWRIRKKKLTRQAAVNAVGELMRCGFVRNAKYGLFEASTHVREFAVHQAIHEGWFDAMASLVEQHRGRHSLPGMHARARIAFYRGDLEEFVRLYKRIERYPVKVTFDFLVPFDVDVFAWLDPVFQEVSLTSSIWKTLLHGVESRTLIDMFDPFAEAAETPSPELLDCWTNVAVARGDFQTLERLEDRSDYNPHLPAGCAAFISGDYERAEASFDSALKQSKRHKRTAVLPGFAGVFHILLMLRKKSVDGRRAVDSMVQALPESGLDRLSPLGDLLSHAALYDGEPDTVHSKQLRDRLSRSGRSDNRFEQIVATHVWKWFVPEETRLKMGDGLKGVVQNYWQFGFSWLAALAEDAAAASVDAFGADVSKRHAKIKTQPLTDFIESHPAWKRTLCAISQLSETVERSTGTETNQRMIWEIELTRNGASGFHLRPHVQKRKASGGWTKGRPVSLERLHCGFESSEFNYLTDQDRRICRAIEVDVQRGYRGYSETLVWMDRDSAAQALIGHPLVFRMGDRQHPVEIVRQDPQLIVRKSAKHIELSLEPAPHSHNSHVRLIEDGSQRLVIVPYGEAQLKLAAIVGEKLQVPKSASDEVVQAAHSAAKLISIQSEVGAGSRSVTDLTAESSPHLHLMPYHAGVRAEFFVRPFGESGPFFRLGEGGENVFADVDGQPKSARRNLKEERDPAFAIVSECPSLADRCDATHASNLEFHYPTMAEALELLVDVQPLSEDGSLHVHWPQGRSLQVAGEACASQLQVRIRKDRDWFAASGKLQVDDALAVDMMKLVELVESTPSRFVQLDDGRFLALTEQLRRRVEELASYGEHRKNKLRFPGIRAAAIQELEDGSVSLKTDKHWKACIQRMREAGELTPEIPSTLQTELRDYQQVGFQWLCRLAHWGVGGCLADDMGLGKTIQALALLLDRAAGGPALIVAPTSVGFNWVAEAQRFAPTLNVRLFGNGDRDAFFQDLGPRDVVVTSYALLLTEAERFQAVPWHTAILDEAQAIKNMATKRSQAAMGLTADFRLVMTGTPLENHLGELWNLFQFINPGLLGSLEQFQKRFAAPIERDDCRETRRRLKQLIQPFILRRTKTQVLDELPPRTEMTIDVTPSDEEAAFYEALRQRAVEKLSELDDARCQHVRILAEITRLRRACCHPRLIADDCGIEGSKLALFSETIDELLDNRHKALVFSQFVDHLSLLRAELDRKRVSYQYLDGSTPARERKRRVEAFQNGDGDVFLISLKAGGLGLNLTAADYVLHMDPWWNPAVEDQASDRTHRLGQQRPVTIYRFVTRGTIEDRIVDLHASKRDLADSLLEGTDVSGKLTAEELLA